MDREKERAITVQERGPEGPPTSPEDLDWGFGHITCFFGARPPVHCHFFPFEQPTGERVLDADILEKNGIVIIAITLPKGVEADAIEVTYKRGVLGVKIPQSGAPETRERLRCR